MRKIFAIVFCFVLVLSACAVPAATPAVETKPTEAAQPVAPAVSSSITVIFPKHEADIKGAYEARIREFEKESGITVNLIQSDWDSVANRVTPELATKGSAYDVVEYDNGWIAQWCGAGWTEPLDAYLPADYAKDMIPGLVNLFSCPDGKVHGVVWNNDTRFFYYNAAKLEQAGFAQAPATWDELVVQSKESVSKGAAKFGMAPSWNQEWSLGNEFHFWTYAFGGNLVDDKGCVLLDKDPNTLKAVQFMMDVLKDGTADPAGLTYNQAASQDIFLKGDSLFLPQGIAGLFSYVKDPAISKVQDQIKTGLVPATASGTSAALTLPEAYAIPIGSKNKEAAAKFIVYMTSKETNKYLAEQIGVLPIWTDLFADPDLTTLYPYWADFQAQLSTARGLSKITWYSDFVDLTNAELHKALAGGQTAQEALDNMAKQLEKFNCVP